MPFIMESAIDPTMDLDVTMYLILSVIGLCLESMAYTKLYQESVKWYEGREIKRIPPGRAQGIFGIVWSGLFILIGLAVGVPLFGAFGVLWTLGAGIIAVLHIRQLFSGRRTGHKDPPAAAAPEVQRKLEQLETLRNAGLITRAEYREKRRKILEEL